jgi:hypothetical protein
MDVVECWLRGEHRLRVDDVPRRPARGAVKPESKPNADPGSKPPEERKADGPAPTATATRPRRSRGADRSDAPPAAAPKPADPPPPSGGARDAKRARRATRAGNAPVAAAPERQSLAKDSAQPERAAASTGRDAARSADSAERSRSGSTPAVTYAEQLERRAREVELAARRDAGALDAAVPQAERDRLRAEQEAFLATAASKPDAKPSGGKVGGMAGGKAEQSSGDAADDAQELDAAVGAGAAHAPLPSVEAQREFFTGRDYWIGPEGDVFLVDVTDDAIDLYRDNDPDGQTNAGLPPVRAAAIATAGGAKPGAGATADSLEPHDEHESHDEHGDAGERDHSHWVARTDAHELGGPGASIAESAVSEPPTSQRGTGRVTLHSSGQVVVADTLDRAWGDGTTWRRTRRTSTGPDPEHRGAESIVQQRAVRPDGSRARIVQREHLGTFADDGRREEYSSVTFTGADGSRRSTNSDRPSTRETPTTLDELRAIQDELGLAYAPDQPLPDGASQVDRIFHEADSAMRSIDRDELQRAALAGARHIAGEDEDLVVEYGDRTFDDVRERLEAFGLDAADGNEQIDRTWLDDGLHDNAYYSRRDDEMVFGVTSDGVPLAVSDDVIAHEFTHRIINSSGGIDYEGQSGAINESLADTMAAAVDEEDWVVGEDAFTGGVRDMSERYTMDDFLVTKDDNGGVHTNSAIPNHAAYLIGEDVGREAMGEIYARTIQDHIAPDMQFTDLARGTFNAAVDLYGRDSAEARAVRQAWDAVLLLEGDGAVFDGG